MSSPPQACEKCGSRETEEWSRESKATASDGCVTTYAHRLESCARCGHARQRTLVGPIAPPTVVTAKQATHSPETVRFAQAKFVEELLRRRFGAFPEHFKRRIRRASMPTLMSYGERLFNASTLRDVLNDPHGSRDDDSGRTWEETTDESPSQPDTWWRWPWRSRRGWSLSRHAQR